MTQDISKVGVVFLARKADGLDAFRRFVQSYLKNDSGHSHELIVALKGFDSESELNAAREIFSTITHLEFRLNDVGFDIGSYLEISEKVSHDYLCFFNTHTEIVAVDWLKLLMKYATKKGVGVAAAMGSYESINSTVERYKEIVWRSSNLFLYKGHPYTILYEAILDRLRPDCYVATGRGNSLLAYLYLPFYRIYCSIKCFRLRKVFIERGADFVWPGAKNFRYQDFPKFPNPHVRSNGFVMLRDRFCEIGKTYSMIHKADANLFESGKNSLTRVILQLDLSALVVGKNGVAYEVNDWGNSNTFRQKNQSNLLIADNHTRAFDAMNESTKLFFKVITWHNN